MHLIVLYNNALFNWVILEIYGPWENLRLWARFYEIESQHSPFNDLWKQWLDNPVFLPFQYVGKSKEEKRQRIYERWQKKLKNKVKPDEIE